MDKTVISLVIQFVFLLKLVVCLVDSKSNFLSRNESDELSLNTKNGRLTFKAAVYEHAVYLPLFPAYSRQGALRVMNQNLDVYEKQILKAAYQGADIIVFPEDGIYGMLFNRDKIKPFLEFIPDPLQEEWNPCADPNRYPNTDVQFRLSCLAKENSIYVVANMGDVKPCNISTDPKCPKDKQYQFNTNVVFDSLGTLVARYHKRNLFYEDQFDTPESSQIYFDTPFGRFGTFTCFDILFRSPAVDLIENHSIDTVVFPTAWRDVLPILSAIEYHSAFAVQMSVNILSANIHLPISRFGGSGVYTPTGASIFYRDDNSLQGKLLIATLSTSPRASMPRKFPQKSLLSTLKNSVKNVSETFDTAAVQNYSEKSSLPLSTNSLVDVPKTLAEHASQRLRKKCSFNSLCNSFQSVVFDDVYNFVWLKSLANQVTVCMGTVCCHLDYNMAAQTNSSGKAYFALGVFDGLHTEGFSYYFQMCTLLKCASSESSSCGQPVKESDTYFSNISLRGAIQTNYVAPEVLVVDEDGREALALSGWTYNRDEKVLQADGLLQPVLTVNLLGRAYEKDQS